jgi:hypothetical protein
MPRVESRSLWITGFTVFWLLWIFVLVFIRLHHSDLDHGTSLSDSAVVSAGVYADQYGLLSTWGFPVFETYRRAGAEPPLYVTYPPGRLWVHQLGKALGLSGQAGSRVLPVVSTSLAVLLAAFLAFQLTNSVAVAALTGFFFSFNQVYAFYFDSLTESVRQFTLLAALVAWLAFEKSREKSRRRLWLALTMTAVFFDAWYTLEHLIFLPLFVVVRAAWKRDRTLAHAAALVVGVVGFTVAMRLLHVTGPLGLDQTLGMFASKAQERIGIESGFTTLESLSHLLPRLGMGEARSMRNPSRFPILAVTVLLPAVPLALVAFLRRRDEAFRSIRAALSGGVLLIAMGMLWPLLMSQHARIHPHTTLSLLPGAALLLAGLAAVGLTTARHQPRPAVAQNIVLAVLSVTLLVGFASEMRHSRTLNLLVQLDHKAVGFNNYREGQARVMRRASRALKGARRVIIPSAQPNIGALLELPFEMRKEDSLYELGAGDYLLDEIDQVSAAWKLYGFPLRFARPFEDWVVFHGGGRPGVDLRIALDTGVLISTIDVVRTLGGRGLTLQLVVTSGPAKPETSEMRAELETFGTGDAQRLEQAFVQLSESESLLSWQISSEPDPIVRLRILDRSGRPLRIHNNPSSPLEGITLESDSVVFELHRILRAYPTGWADSHRSSDTEF